MSNPIYPRAICFFTTNEEARNVTSGVLIDCLPGEKKKKQKKQKVEKIDFHCFPVSSVYICSGRQQGMTERRWHTKKCTQSASGTPPSNPCTQPSDHRLPPWGPEIPKGTSFRETASGAATPRGVCRSHLSQKGHLNCCR